LRRQARTASGANTNMIPSAHSIDSPAGTATGPLRVRPRQAAASSVSARRAPAVRLQQGGQDAHGRRLAGSVRAEHAEDRACRGGEVYSCERVRLAEALNQALGLDRCRHLHCLSREVVARMILPFTRARPVRA
jgi:hypothetical protein